MSQAKQGGVWFLGKISRLLISRTKICLSLEMVNLAFHS